LKGNQTEKLFAEKRGGFPQVFKSLSCSKPAFCKISQVHSTSQRVAVFLVSAVAGRTVAKKLTEALRMGFGSEQRNKVSRTKT
jgi:hypothetical protein